MKKTAFTLAEVLITLGIIGVVAAMTIPTLMNSTNKKELITALKKNYTILSQAAALAANDNGGSLTSACASNNDHACFAGLFKPYLNTTSYCPADGTTTCWHAANNWYFGDGVAITYNRSDRANMILNDGSLLSFSASNADCSHTPDTYYTATQLCGSTYVDVNGFKKPNTIGKDIFQVVFLPNSTLPGGAPSITQSAYVGDTCNSGIGWAPCTNYYMYEYK